MRTTILVDSKEFWAQLSQDIQNAQKSIYIQTFSFEGDQVGKTLTRALLASPALDKKIIVDDYTKWMISDKFLYSPRNLFNVSLRQEVHDTKQMIDELEENGVKVQFTRPVGILEKFAMHNHKKVILIDRQIAYIGGINFCEHNFLWHDSMLRLDDVGIAEALYNDFHLSWAGVQAVTNKNTEDFELYCLNGCANHECFDKILALIDGAKEQIFVESPYITFPFLDHLIMASQRGCAVTLITPGPNNQIALRDYILWETASTGLDVRLYDRMSHLKAMLIDQCHLILGSSNFDYFSYKFHQEIVAITTNPELVAEFNSRVFLEDIRHSKHGFQIGKLRGSVIAAGMRIAAKIITYLARNRSLPEPQTINIPSPANEKQPVLPRSNQ
jgi:cardiolipin synthase